MAKLPLAIVVYPGSNCEKDCLRALDSFSEYAPFLISSQETSFPPDTKGILIPGGFSYGDYLRPGVMAKSSPITRGIYREAKRGIPILGICNGFQVLCELGLLPGVLLKNQKGKFICKEVFTRVLHRTSPFLRCLYGQIITLSIAHKYGRYYCGDLANWKNQLGLCYCGSRGEDGDNPNGSIQAIAGMVNPSANILGLMPHPERRAFGWMGGEDGRKILQGFSNFWRGSD